MTGRENQRFYSFTKLSWNALLHKWINNLLPMELSFVHGERVFWSSRPVQSAATSVCVLASPHLMQIWLHGWINGPDRKWVQVAHSPSVQMSSPPDCTVDALFIRARNRYSRLFQPYGLSFKQDRYRRRGEEVSSVLATGVKMWRLNPS